MPEAAYYVLVTRILKAVDRGSDADAVALLERLDEIELEDLRNTCHTMIRLTEDIESRRGQL